MKRAIILITLVWLGAVVLVVATGCGQKASSAANGTAVNGSVMDVSAPAPQQQQQFAEQPVVYDSVTTPQPAAPSDSADLGATPGFDAGLAGGGSSYTVKKGDTLYSLARQRYGDGKQWTRIADANPGLRPETLKAGQTITIP